MRSVIFSADKGRASCVDIRGKPALHCARNHHGELAACARPFLLRIDGCGLWSSGDCGEAGETASTACQIDRDALIEVLRGPYATYEERADAVCDLLGGQGEG